MMSRLIAFANRKGGSGKTATAVNVAAILANKGYSTLLVDTDPQAHATISLGISPYRLPVCIKEILLGEASVSQVLLDTSFSNLNIIPSSQNLETINDLLKDHSSPETILAEKLEAYISDFEFILFDCPATPGVLLNNALVASQELLVPMQTHFLAMEGLVQITRMVYEINAKFNPSLRLIGVIPTLSNQKTRLYRSIQAEVRKNFGDNFLYPPIRLDVKLAESPSYGKPMIYYAPRSNGSKDYIQLTEHLLEVAN